MKTVIKYFTYLFLSIFIVSSFAGQNETEVISAVLTFKERFKDISAKGEFKSSLYLEQKEKETVIGNFEYKRLGDDYYWLERFFDKPKPNGSIGDIIIERQDKKFYFQYFTVTDSNSQNKILKAIEQCGVDFLLSPFGYIIPVNIPYSRLIQENRQYRFIAPETTDTLCILEIAYPFEVKCGSEPMYKSYASDLSRFAIKKLNPLHISYISHSLVPPDGRKITLTEVFVVHL